MSRLKADYENKLSRKRNRNITFDSYRDFNEVSSEHCNLQLLQLFHNILIVLSRCALHSETEVNSNILDEVEHLLPNNKYLVEKLYSNEVNVPQLSSSIIVSLNSTNHMRLISYLNSLLKPTRLLRFKSCTVCNDITNFDIKDCLDRLKREATYFLRLSRGFTVCENHKRDVDDIIDYVTNYGLRLEKYQKINNVRRSNKPYTTTYAEDQQIYHDQANCSFLANLRCIPHNSEENYISSSIISDFNCQTHGQSEVARFNLKNHLQYTITQNEEELVPLDTFAKLQATARNILSTPIKYEDHNVVIVLLQVIEDFCREGDTIVESVIKYRDDLQSQINAADKQLKSTRRFLEEQAVDREQERDDFIMEIKRLEKQLNDKDKEIYSLENATKKLQFFEDQNSELMEKLIDSNHARDKFEIELKASIDKIFTLREIISELESQIEANSLKEHDLKDKITQLEDTVSTCSIVNDKLQMEVQCLKTEISKNYKVKIQVLEEQLGYVCSSTEQNIVLEKLADQLRDIENALDQKTKTLELLQQYNSSTSCSEDISAQCFHPFLEEAIAKSWQISTENAPAGQLSLSMQSVEKIFEKLNKHSRIEESILKCFHDRDMQIIQIRNSYLVLQHERDSLQERVLEQTLTISGLQLLLDEQRKRNEEIQRASMTDLNIRIHDLKTEVQNLRETLELRDKQIHTMKDQLKKSKITIDRLEAELSIEHKPQQRIVDRLETTVKEKNLEIQFLKDRIKTEMINKLALPDLMETMLADKNEEIDHLKEQLVLKEKELKYNEELSKVSSVEKNGLKCDQTLSDIVSIAEFDEPDVVRRGVAHNFISSSNVFKSNNKSLLQTQLDTLNKNIPNSIKYHSENFYTVESGNTFEYQHYLKNPIVFLNTPSVIPSLVPRQIHFSALVNDSKLETPKLFSSGKKDKTPHTFLQCSILEDEFNEKQIETKKFNHQNIEEETIELKLKNRDINDLLSELTEKSFLIENLLHDKRKLLDDNKEKKYLLSKAEANLINYRENEDKYSKRIEDLENQMFIQIKGDITDRDNLRKELQRLSELHAIVLKDAADSQKKMAKLQDEIMIKRESLKSLTSKICMAEKTIDNLQKLVRKLEYEIEILRQQNSENNSKQFSVDEIAKEVEKELIYAAQLDSNILKAIECEEENKIILQKPNEKYILNRNNSDEDNFKKERELLNELESLKSRVAVEREFNSDICKELISVKEQSQKIQEQDMLFIETMRNRLESAVEKEEDLHKLLDIERDRSVQLKSQLAKLQHLEFRLNLSHQLEKSHSEKLHSFSEYGSEYVNRLREGIKLFQSQYIRERARRTDIQQYIERERLRYQVDLQHKIGYIGNAKHEMAQMSQFVENAKIEIQHLNNRLIMKDEEIENLKHCLEAVQKIHTSSCMLSANPQKKTFEVFEKLNDINPQIPSLKFDCKELKTTITTYPNAIKQSAQQETVMSESSMNTNEHQLLHKMIEINELLTENTHENWQMAETVKFLVEDRRKLQDRCADLEMQLANIVSEIEERFNHLLGRYLRAESHRKNLVYQKRYLNISLQSFQTTEQRAMFGVSEGDAIILRKKAKYMFRTVALSIIAIVRMKYIGRIWHTGKRIISKSDVLY